MKGKEGVETKTVCRLQSETMGLLRVEGKKRDAGFQQQDLAGGKR